MTSSDMTKRFFIATVLFCLASVMGFAQASVNSGNPALDITVKRAVVQGSDCYVDIVCTVSKDWGAVVFQNKSRHYQARFFDDEGSFYANCIFEVDGTQTTYNGFLNVAKDIPRKMRFVIRNLDEYASSFTLIEVPYTCQGGSAPITDGKLVIKNLSITR